MGLKAKQCKEEGCEFPAWSKGKCRIHMEAKPPKLKSTRYIKQSGYDKEKMFALYDLHWDTHPDKKCESCGKQLYGENLTLYHDHLLEKSVYPQYAYDLDNLFLCCSKCHSAKSMKNPTPTHLKAIKKAYEERNITLDERSVKRSF